MRPIWAVLTLWAAAPAAAAELSLAPVAGYQLLEHTSPGISHGRLDQEVFFGRSVVGGLGLDLGLAERHHLRLELQVGPYHGDFDRYCIVDFLPTGTVCDKRVDIASRHALVAGLDYTIVPGAGRVRPVIGAGLGVKRYSFAEDPPRLAPFPTTSLTLSAVAGMEIATHAPVRLEARFLYLPDHPLVTDAVDSSMTELHLSLSVRIPLSGR